MDPTLLKIETGKAYVVEFAGRPFSVVAVKESTLVPDWWWCKAADGQSTMFPRSAFCEEVAETN